jgi:hypothetical protein
MRLAISLSFAVLCATSLTAQPAGKTIVSIDGQSFLINGKPTYAGREYRGMKIQGLFLNARLVQGIFDDLNPETRDLWRYPDTGRWDARRNTRELAAAMPEWRRQGLIAFTINLQGGSPQGYSKDQPWENSAFTREGDLRPDDLERLATILDRADELGMVVILGYFYFGQEPRFADEATVIKARTPRRIGCWPGVTATSSSRSPTSAITAATTRSSSRSTRRS